MTAPRSSTFVGPSPVRLRHRGFTLVELLVVIAIVAVLAALLVPAALLALGLADIVTCQNNLRNIAVGYRQYMTDSGGLWPPMLVNDPPQALLARIKEDTGLAPQASSATRAGPHWSIVLWPYFRTMSIYTCPADPKKGLRGDAVWRPPGISLRNRLTRHNGARLSPDGN